MVEIAEKATGNKPGLQEGDEAIKKLHSSESQRGLLQKRVTGVNRDKRIEAALLFISGVETSPTRLAEKFGVVKNSILRWKKKDGWVELAHQTDQITRASLPEGVAAFRIKMIHSLEDDIALIDSKKHEVKAKSLEGLLKAKAALGGELRALLGIGNAEESKVTIIFGGYGPAPGLRGSVQIPGKIATADDGTPGIEALSNDENTAESEGGLNAQEGGIGSSIRMLGGKSSFGDKEIGGEEMETKNWDKLKAYAEKKRVEFRAYYEALRDGDKQALEVWYKLDREEKKRRLTALKGYGFERGDLKRQPCEVCKEAEAEIHHASYDYPFDFTWLCQKHHVEVETWYKRLAKAIFGRDGRKIAHPEEHNEEKVSERVATRGGQKLSGGGTKTTEDLTLEEAISDR